MGTLVLVVLWALSMCKGLESISEKHVPRSLEETTLGSSSGICSTWGNGAFRTFDDQFYHFTSTCNYVLSRHCKSGAEDFNIQIRRGSNGNLEHIYMQIEGVKILVVNETISVQDVIINLPHHDKVIGIYKYGIDTRLSNRKHTISVNWNSGDALSVSLDDKYQGHLCGLCGKFEKNSSSTYDSTFINSNKLDVLGHTCSSNPHSESSCEASTQCEAISALFLSCFDNRVIGEYWKMCQADVCSCKGSGCKCAFFAEVARKCDKETFLMWQNWRTQENCTLPTCPGNQLYKECGPACLPTCTDPNPEQQCDQCVNTCVCPEGKVLDNIRGTNRCIPERACPCEYSGEIYRSGEIRNTSCQSCICESGKWSCSYHSCPGRCTIEEATYFTTFDNTYYSMIGDCSYYAVFTEDWTIKVDIHQCQAAFKQTCLQRVTLTMNQTTFVFSNDGNVYFEGNEVAITLRTGGIIIFQQSSMYFQVTTTFGLKMQVQIFPVMQLYISLPVDAKGSTKGLCGTFNDDADDDFLSAQGIVESTPITFANSWKTEDSCSEPTIPSPCVSSENENYAKQHCSHLNDPAGAFSICHSAVDYMKYYQMCVAATCACENINDCLCAGLGAYVHECAAHGILVRNWRGDICNKPCPNTQVFENDMRTCNRTCRSLSEYDYTCGVKDVPVYGCGCPEGKYMDNTGVCIDKSDCSCYIGERVIKKGQSITLNGRTCTCENGKPSCPIVPATSKPGCLNGKVYNDCANAVLNKKYNKKTCRSQNIPSSNSHCVPGCICPDNLVEDDSGRCILPEQCPCLFGGESHAAGKTIQRDCNKCTCRAGEWHCTTNPCPKTCQVYGDGQYVTFDGKRYMFDGNCEYIFAEDYCNQGNETFQILTESVPCCENGVTCSRNIKILLEDKEFILTDGRVVRADKSGQTQCTDNSYSLHTVGLYLILTFTNGITVIWDKRTRLSITLDPRWKNNVCGLCGNFNDDVADDLTTKGNSLVSNAVKFGSSWKSSLSCSDAMNQTFPCDRNPYCLAWAQRRCSIIKDAAFQKCYKKVDPTPFYDACIQEACACDLEGKYLGFCTAVAVYAEACNKAGVCVDWRTPELCPVYCDYYNSPGECSWHYQPCGTLTTKTCSDHYIGKKFSAVLEGCYAKCPENAPYLDENKMKCVNLSECTCYYNGKILLPGKSTRNDCEECECKNGKVTCIAPSKTTVMTTPTSTTTYTIEETTTTTIWKATTTEMTPPPVIPTTTPSTTSYVPETTPSTMSTTKYIPGDECNGEWSRWFNEHTPSLISPGDSELLDPTRNELCPSSSDAINKIQCQFVDYPEWPVSESTDNVTCDKDTGLVCIFSENTVQERKFCYDYQIRVCCEPQIITEWTTTTLPETTSTTMTSEPTPSILTSTSTTSTTSYIPETTSTTVIPTKTTSTTSYIPGDECNGEWSRWFNEHTPSLISPGDSELLDPTRNELCPSSSDAINKIQCQFVDYPEWPVSESTDNVTCDKDTGLVCIFSENTVQERKFCYDYQIRVCCEPQIITEWTTTTLPETTSTTMTSEPTPSILTSTSTTSTTSYIPETTSTTVIPTKTTSTTSYIPGDECNGEWSRWFNEHTPSLISPGDSELLDPTRNELCPSSSDAINKIQCQFVDYPEWPVSESTDNVTCDKDTGLVCIFSENTVQERKFCYDYQIRVCCEPQIITEWTTTTLPETTSTTMTSEPTPSILTSTSTTSTTSYIPETTSTTVIPTKTTSTTSYIPGDECNGEWSRWFNEHTPSLISPGDSELLDPTRNELCPSSSDAINKIQCQFVDYPEWPVSESTDNVTCDKDTGLVCIFSENTVQERKFCYDYQIRVCCEPQIITEWTTTTLPETTSTTMTSEPTPSILTSTSTTSTTSYIPETTSTTVIPTKTTSTTSYIPGDECNGEWSRWFNEHTPSLISPGDSELLDPTRNELCPSSSDAINKIQCQFVDYPEWPVSESTDNVTCDKDTGLVCIFSENTVQERKFCYDYQIRVCCEPQIITEWTTTTLPETTSTTMTSEPTPSIVTSTSTTSTTSYIPETTSTTVIPTKTTSTTSYIPGDECNGEWSRWFNEHTPSLISPGDSELLDPTRNELCPSSSDAINKIQCQFVDYPEWPVSESTDNVTCDKDTGLVCIFSENTVQERKFCYDYQIRVCCEPQIITEWTTTTLPETTSTTMTSEPTPSILTSTSTTSTTSYIPETTSTTVIPTKTTSTTSYIPGDECNGEWSRWFNEHTPSLISPGDSELLDPTRNELCPSSSDAINKIQCQFVDYPEWPVSESTDNVTCDKDTGLVCIFSENTVQERKFCYDYQIRVCCEPQIITEWTTTTLPETTSTTMTSEPTPSILTSTSTTSTTSYIPETTSTTVIPTKTTSTTSYIPGDECNGEWSRWFNEHTPSLISPGDSELLDPTRNELCPSSSDAINKIQCQFVDYPEWPVSESTDNVTCDKDTGLVCIFSENTVQERKFCYDYQIRVCCEPQIITEWTTTTLPETTSTTMTSEPTPSIVTSTSTTSTTSYIPETTSTTVIPTKTTSTTSYIPGDECNGEWSRWFNEHTPSLISPGDSELLDPTRNELCPSSSDAINKIQCQFVDYPEWPVSESTDNVTCDKDTGLVCIFSENTVQERKFCYDYQIRVCCEPQIITEWTTTTLPETTSTTMTSEPTPSILTSTSTTSTTSYIPETTSTTVIPTKTTSTTSYIPGDECNGEWSRWFNEHTPSLISPGDSELLDPTRNELCPSSSDAINKIQCQFVDYPEWPVSESTDNVTCDKDTGLVCIFSENTVQERKFCYDYQIRVCCEPQIITEWTTTTLPETTSTTMTSEPTPSILTSTSTTSTTSYIPETTSTTVIPTKTTSTTSYIPGDECNGEWSRWFNEHTPSLISPGDSELLDPTRNELCPSSSDAINKIQCQFVDYPEWPVSESTDNVTCDKDTGLVCIFSENTVQERKFCYDYQIRVCCEPQIITEWTTTTLPETTSTTMTSEPTPSILTSASTMSTTSYIPETTSTTVIPTKTTSTTSYIPGDECNGEWSRWFNEHTPSLISPGDSELLDPTRNELCPSSSDAINKIQCQFVDYPEWPVSESTDNVTCDKDTGLVCIFSENTVQERKFCYDYQIRVCCEPQIITEWTTTTLPETTSTTMTSEPTPSIVTSTSTTSTTSYIPETTSTTVIPTKTTSTTSYIPGDECNGEWSRWFNEHTPSLISPGDSELLDPTRNELCPSSSDAINKIQCQFVDYPEWPVSESTDNVTCDKDTGLVCIFSENTVQERKFCYDYQIRVCCEPQIITEWTTTTLPETTSTTMTSEPTPSILTSTSTTSTTSYIPETTSTTVIPTKTTSTTSYIPGDECNGEWSRWFNEHTPSLISPGDSELLDPTRNELCPSSSDAINKIQCQFVDYPEWPVSESTDNVTCDKDTGLVCIFSENTVQETKFCYDYQIRVCCEPQIITEWTTTTLPETTSTTMTSEPTSSILTSTSTTSTTSYIPEYTEPSTTPGRYTTVTTTTSQSISTTTTELFCNGKWSPWFNENTPSIQNKGDSELLEPIHNKLCPFTPYQISAIDCEAVKFPQRPITETKDNVTCDINKGLVCNYNEQMPENHLMCLDYRIRVCCEPTLTTQIPKVNTTIYEPTIHQVTVPHVGSCKCSSNPPRKCMETWKENCTMITCIKGDLFKMDPIVCPELIKPTCRNDIQPVKVRTANGCCEKWECDCECEVWGDPHFHTFDGLWYDFYENCTYTLVEEQVPKYNFSVLVDNYFCLPSIRKSCPKGLVISYNGNVVQISTGETYSLTVNGNDVSLPFSSEGFNITKLGISTYISIPDIRTSITAFRNAFNIRVPEQYFINNTQGQCGSCSHTPPQCIRKNGKVEPSDCCHRTAYDWRVADPNKPYCQSAPTNLPCTPVPPPPTCKPEQTICDIIQGKPFEQCRRKINLDQYIKTCIFDYCALNSTIDCSSLETAALVCASVGICVDWRPFTNGVCNYTCDQGLVYKPCQSKKDDQCENHVVIAGATFTPAVEGCFCPDGMILSEDKFKCVASCQVCRDYLGHPRQEGETWEDAKNPCISYGCTEYGVVIQNKSCNQDETCPEALRIYVDRCCFICTAAQGLCRARTVNETIRLGTCEATIEAKHCEGHCSSATQYDFKINHMDHYCQCCQEYKTQKMTADLQCKNGKTHTVEYTAIKSCICKACGTGKSHQTHKYIY
ncbi:mucin-2-like isoform X2 [Heterodontus francisci]|uniref:mucin-2-like isoform X2 n=1 Tax=Heterodontus francisci TaxID=7792 RepID=UPI00355AD4DB